jgi:hypothetical protein
MSSRSKTCGPTSVNSTLVAVSRSNPWTSTYYTQTWAHLMVLLRFCIVPVRFCAALFHARVIFSGQVWQLPDKSNNIPDRIICVCGSKCRHSRHIDPILDDPEQLGIFPSLSGSARLGGDGCSPRPMSLVSLPGAPWQYTHISLYS